MEDILRWSLLALGSCVIVGVAVHGIWVSRKNREQKSSAKKSTAKQEFQSGAQYPADEISVDSDPEDKYDNLTIGNDDEVEEPIIDLNVDVETELNKSEFDDLGLGSVRVVSSSPEPSTPATSSPTESEASEETPQNAESTEETTPAAEEVDALKVEKESSTTHSSKIYASVVTQPKPEYANKYQSLALQTVAISQQEKAVASGSTQNIKANMASKTTTSAIADGYEAPEPPPFLLKKDQQPEMAISSEAMPTSEQTQEAVTSEEPEEDHSTLAEKLSLTEQAMNLVKRKKLEPNKKRRAPKIAKNQMHIDFDDEPAAETSGSSSSNIDNKSEVAEQPQEVLVLNVKTTEGEPILGAALLPMLLTLGFKFGDQDIFHRHVNSNGKGPVLFSLANMFKPGNFDIDNLENFTTQGISLFMILPIEGDPHQVFNMMHNAARKISEEFSAQIYDGKRALLTQQSGQQYVEKIREFERQRLLNS